MAMESASSRRHRAEEERDTELVTASQRLLAKSKPPSGVIRFKTFFLNTILDVMLSRGWKQITEDSGWDMYWCDVGWIRESFDSTYFPENARVCHFRNHYELTRKDMVAKNLKRFRKELERQAIPPSAPPGKRTASLPPPPPAQPNAIKLKVDFLPTTFKLPSEYRMFVEEFKKQPSSAWIMKPVGSSQGKGIFLVTKLSQLAEWRADTRFTGEELDEEDKPAEYIVQKYVENPYLVGGRKFDLRIYCLVTSFQPLRAWLYREAFARFTFVRYSMDDLSNTVAHLTNVAIQKKSTEYDKSKGCKWMFCELKRHLITCHGRQAVQEMLRNIDNIILTSLHSVQKMMINDRHCFELYGFDVLLDGNLKPWLMEINASPSLTADTHSDYALKFRMLNDMFNVVDLERRRQGNETRVGGFDLIWDDKQVFVPSPIEGLPPVPNSWLGSYHEDRDEQLDKVFTEAAERRARAGMPPAGPAAAAMPGPAGSSSLGRAAAAAAAAPASGLGRAPVGASSTGRAVAASSRAAQASAAPG
eukprot:m.18593 g.18593  ORF g.18593 m.18593 type:complete len:531 (-) comp3357_c0_seq2:999-2591(-)